MESWTQIQKKLGAIGAGNREILNEQQYIAKNGARALEKYADESPRFARTLLKTLNLRFKKKLLKEKVKSTAKTYLFNIKNMF